MDNSQMTRGERLAIRRRLAGFSQQEVADRLGVTRQTLLNWERGKVEVDDLRFRTTWHALDLMLADRAHQLAELDGGTAA